MTNDLEETSQACIKVRLFHQEEDFFNKNVEKISERFADILVDEFGFSNSEYVDSIIYVSSNDFIPDYFNEYELAQCISNNSRFVILPDRGKNNE
jgi:hypothetical protein